MEPSPAIKALVAKVVTDAHGVHGATMVILRVVEGDLNTENLKELKKDKAMIEVLITYPDAPVDFLTYVISEIQRKLTPRPLIPGQAAPAAGGRKMTRKYCKKTSCKKMGFTQKASCRPYKNCYKNKK